MPTTGELLWHNNISSARLAQIGATFVVASVCLVVFYGSENWQIPTFAWHPLLVTLGLFFLVQSILILQPTKAQAEKKIGLQWHQILILCASLPMMTMGAWIIWCLHSLPGQKHFISWHGLLGFCIIMLLWLQVLFGASTVYWKNVFYGTESRAKAMWKYHRYVLHRLQQHEWIYIVRAPSSRAYSGLLGSSVDEEDRRTSPGGFYDGHGCAHVIWHRKPR